MYFNNLNEQCCFVYADVFKKIVKSDFFALIFICTMIIMHHAKQIWIRIDFQIR